MINGIDYHTCMEYLIGFGVALSVCLAATLVGFDKDRAFYPVVLIVIASYYILFAAMGASIQTLFIELAAAATFAVVAIVGFKRYPWFIVVGLAAHGVFDLLHPLLTHNPGVPVWWPSFCLAYDVTAAVYLLALLKFRAKIDV
jgi:hypothetical protein